MQPEGKDDRPAASTGFLAVADKRQGTNIWRRSYYHWYCSLVWLYCFTRTLSNPSPLGSVQMMASAGTQKPAPTLTFDPLGRTERRPRETQVGTYYRGDTPCTRRCLAALGGGDCLSVQGTTCGLSLCRMRNLSACLDKRCDRSGRPFSPITYV